MQMDLQIVHTVSRDVFNLSVAAIATAATAFFLWLVITITKGCQCDRH